MISIKPLPEFDASPYLESEESIAAYLTDILEANDAALLASALGDIARARGMTEIAKSAGITREALSLLEDYSWPGNVRQLENTIQLSYSSFYNFYWNLFIIFRRCPDSERRVDRPSIP